MLGGFMEDARRSIDKSSDIVVKRRTSSGCLIVRKKIGDGGGGSAACSARGIDLKTVKRQRVVAGESESSEDELPKVARRGIGIETLRSCNGLTGSRNEGFPIGEGVSRNGVDGGQRSNLDVFEFEEYEGDDGRDLRRGVKEVEGGGSRQGFGLGGRSGRVERELEYGSASRQVAVERRKSMYFDETSFGISDRLNKKRFDTSRERSWTPPLQMRRDKHEYKSQETIRVQGKNGVLKVLVNKKKVTGSASCIDQLQGRGSRKLSISERMSKNIAKSHPLSPSEMRRAISGSISQKSTKRLLTVQKHAPVKLGQSHDDWDSKYSDELRLMKDMNLEKHNPMKKVLLEEKSSSHLKVLTKILSTGLHRPARKPDDWDSEDSDVPPKPKHRKVEPRMDILVYEKDKSRKSEDSPLDKTPEMAHSKDKKSKCGSGTEKQKLRELIREILLDAGWTIDYRPRRNRDYQDSVYINPSGTAYWSIIKAYEAFQKQHDDNHGSAYMISNETLGQLTRKTKKKMEKELKMKQREARGSVGAKPKKKMKIEEMDVDSNIGSDNNSDEDKLSLFMKQGVKPSKIRPNDKSSSLTEGLVQDRESKNLGRCTLLVRRSDKGTNSETDGFVPYSGKRTLLSWLIDSGVVEVGQKVRYMNERRTWVLLEGWITDDGIHCGCCSKILTVSKFEIHAGSKLSRPFENICVESGDSLLQCQINAWNRQDKPSRLGFHTVDSVGDDPNDDTCAICGDGGDLICCDGCPSTFHQNCLHIPMLPPGDWHCPYCICKYCGKAVAHSSPKYNADAMEMLTCNMCKKKFHKSCVEDVGGCPINSDSSLRSFCHQKCGKLFKKLQKYLGVKHELEAGFSWSILHRTDIESESCALELAKRVESNSKLAVAVTIMDECFSPITDRRSQINIIQHVVYNCGSNFNRLNYSGFYAAVLERDDEIVSAASLRFHDSWLAEMPFIGTRHVHRRQGMCHRLFSAIEMALYSLEIEKLVIPAISELTDTWTLAFGFTPLRQEMRSLNMLVFPGLDMLQKCLLKQDAVGRSERAAFLAERDISGGNNLSTHEASRSAEKDSKSNKMKNDQAVSVDNTLTTTSSSDDAISKIDLANKTAGSTLHEDAIAPSKVRDEARDMEEDTMLSNNSDEKEIGVACEESSLNTGLNNVGYYAEVEISEDFFMSECKDGYEKQQLSNRASPRSNLCLDNVGTSVELQQALENHSSSEGADADDEKQIPHRPLSESNLCHNEAEANENPCSIEEPTSLSDAHHNDRGNSETFVDNEEQLSERSLSESNTCCSGICTRLESLAVENDNDIVQTGVRHQDLENSCCQPDDGHMPVSSMLQVFTESTEQEVSHVESKGDTTKHKNSGMDIKAMKSAYHCFPSLVEPLSMSGENGASNLEPMLYKNKVEGALDDTLETEIVGEVSLLTEAPIATEDGGG